MQALYSSLQVADTEYSLVVMLTPAVPVETREKLASLGSTVELRDVEPLPSQVARAEGQTMHVHTLQTAG